MQSYGWKIIAGLWLAAGAAAADTVDGVKPAAENAADKVELRLRLQAGKIYLLRMTMDMKTSQIIQKQKMDMNTTTGFGLEYHVTGVAADGVAAVTMTYRSVVFNMTMRMGNKLSSKIEYDSSQAGSAVPAAAKPVASLVGQSISLKMAPNGRVRDIQGLDALMTNMLKQFPPAQRALMEKSFKGQFGDAAMKEMIEGAMSAFPDGPVGIGDSWTQTVVLNKGFPMTMTNTMTLKERRNGVAVIASRAVFTSNPQAAPMEMGGLKMGYNLSGQQQGTMEMDEATGLVVRSQATQRLSGQIKMSGPKIPPGAASQLYQSGTIKFESREITAPASPPAAPESPNAATNP